MAARVSLAELGESGFVLHSAEAAAIVIEVCRQFERGELRGIPSAHVIRLTPEGRVVAQGPITTDQPPIARAAHLLDDLLPPFDAPASYRVPGGLRLVVARALRTLDLPPFVSLEAFCEALDRFAADDLAATARNLYESWEYARTPRALTISDLRRARRSTGLSLEDISGASGVSVPLLRELEWGYFKNWRSDDEGREQLARYARAAGLDEQVVASIAWPMIEDAAGGGERSGAPGDALVVSGPQTLVAMPHTVTARPKRAWSIWALASAAALALVAALTSTLWRPHPVIQAPRTQAAAPTSVPLPVPEYAAAGAQDAPVHAVQTRHGGSTRGTAARPAVKRASALARKPPSRPNFFKRQLLRIVIR